MINMGCGTKVGMDEVASALQSEKSELEKYMTWPADPLFMACVRELDQLYVGRQFCGWQLGELETLALSGGFESIHLLHGRTDFSKGTPIFDQTPELENAARACLLLGANISMLTRLTALQVRGLVQVEPLAERHVLVRLSQRAGVETREQRFVHSFWQSKYNGIDRLLKEHFGEVDNDRVARELSDGVRPWGGDFIGYSTTPFLDDAFMRLASAYVVKDPLASFFPDATLLGGHRFDEVKVAAMTLVSFALKHVHFALKLIEKRPQSRLINLLSVSSERDGLASHLGAACGFEQEGASEILDLFVLERGDEDYRYEFDSCLPPVIATSATQVVMPAFGVLSSPFAFMLRRLRSLYTRDWDVAVNSLEAAFRRDLYNVFQGTRFHCVPTPVKLRLGGKVLTDVDAAVFDVISGTLGLYQLKWQLPYWGSLKESASRTKNFISGGESWGDRVAEFLKDAATEDIQRLFGIPKSTGSVRQVMGFVLGRFFSECTQADPERLDGITWGSWAQFVEARRAAQEVFDTQDTVGELLRLQHCAPPEDLGESHETVGPLKISYAREGPS